MKQIAKFEKVSFEQFKKDWIKSLEYFPYLCQDKNVVDIYNKIKMPKRATSGSAGYDFFMPMNLNLAKGMNILIPTGIRCKIDDGWVLKEYPRSGQGFKYGVHLANTVGIIDSDYYYSDNEGHIFMKLVNDSSLSEIIRFHQGDAFCQGIFVEYGITYDDETTEIRNGGFGSTSK